MSEESSFEKLEEVSTVEMLTELKRRFRVLQRPEGSVLLLGPPGSGKNTQAKNIRAEFGFCGIDGEQIKAENDTMNTLKKISDQLQHPRCRRGFVLSGFPATAEEAGSFEKMLQVDFPQKTVFAQYKVVELVSEDTQALEQRVTNKETFASRLSVWINNKAALFASNARFSRRAQVDARRSPEEVTKEIFEYLSKA